MDYVFVFSGMFVIVIALFKRELLIHTNSYRIILIISLIFFCTGLIIHFSEAGRNSSCGALLTGSILTAIPVLS